MAATEASGTLHLPSTWKRYWALMVDGIIFFLPSLLFFALGLFRIAGGELILPWVPYLFSAVVTISFYFFCLVHWSRTPGKMLFGLYITDAQTLTTGLSAKQAALRMLGGVLCVPFSLAPMAYAFFRTDRRQLSDLIAGTQVMQEAPRKNPPKIRWIVGGLLVVYFFITGAMSFLRSIEMSKFSAEGISISLAAPEAAPAAKSVKPAPEAAKAPAPAPVPVPVPAPVQAAAPASAKAEAAAPASAPAPANSGVDNSRGVAAAKGTQGAGAAPNPGVADKTVGAGTGEKTARPREPKPESASGTSKRSRASEDARRCLDLASSPEVIKCANEYR